MIKFFCNRCERPLGDIKGQPFTRFDRQSTRMATVLIMIDGQGEGEICHECIQDIILNGTHQQQSPPVATLQSQPPQESQPLQPPEQAQDQIFEPSTVTPV